MRGKIEERRQMRPPSLRAGREVENWECSWECLLRIGTACSAVDTTVNFQYNQIPGPIALVCSRLITIPSRRLKRRHRERKQKWGCCAGVPNRLRQAPFKPTLPSIYLTNVTSTGNKISELKIVITAQNWGGLLNNVHYRHLASHRDSW